ncbi:MAG: metalloregulator ArsR/SmtB family transcription factor [Pseudomonadota bacterium]
MHNRQIKDHLYEQVARIGKVLSSAKRLELIEILCQGEFSVERLAEQAAISVRLTSAHLQELKLAQLVLTRRDGKYIFYRLADTGVATLWVALREAAEGRLSELREAMQGLVTSTDELTPLAGTQLLAMAKRGDIVVIDVRADGEFVAGHLPYARSLPLVDLKKRLKILPKNKPIVAYCRGPFCLMAKEAVALLKQRGYVASRSELGVAEWRAQGLPLVVGIH